MVGSTSDDALRWSVPLNDLSRGWIANSSEVLKAVQRVVASGSYILGREVKEFEKDFARYLGIENVVGVASGSDALELALLAVGCRTGSTIATTPNAGGYASLAAANIEATVLYADMDPITELLTAKSARGVLVRDIDALVVTHSYGNVEQVDEIRKLCEPLNVPIVEDCSQAAGASLGRHKVESFWEAVAFSYYPSKNFGAMGDAGVVTSPSRDIIEKVRVLAQYGWDKPYHVVGPDGMNSRLDEIQATVLRVGLPQLDTLNRKRRDIVRSYAASVEGVDMSVITAFSDDSVAHLAVIMAGSESLRENVRERLTKAGIQTSIHYPVLDYEQQGFMKPVHPVATPVADDVCRRIFTVPCFPNLTDVEISQFRSVLSQQISGIDHG